MSGLSVLLIHLYALSSPITMGQRCACLDSSSLIRWVHSERTRGDQPRGIGGSSKRKNPWLPDIKLSAGVTIDDGDQYRVLDSDSVGGFRTSAVSEGGQRTNYEVSLKWFLSTHASSAQQLSWNRFVAQQTRQRVESTSRLIRVFSRCVSALERRCDRRPVPGLDAALFELELELEQLSEGRFYLWLKENK